MALASSYRPLRGDPQRDVGLYPVPLPLGWKLIGAKGEDVPIPAVANAPFHRIHAQGGLLATESRQGNPPELMMLRPYPLPGPPSNEILEKYTKSVLDAGKKQDFRPQVVAEQIAPCAYSDEPCIKLVVQRSAATDKRTEVHYLLRDRGGQSWELVYLLRMESLRAWVPLFAEIDCKKTA
jgi:hypothetical protein